MCAIAGIVRFSGLLPEKDVVAVRAMTDAQAHRGPDAEGFWNDGAVALGHRRLSIIDLSPRANQPMANEDESVWIVYNGEIYNHAELAADLSKAGHRFRSASDTESILHGYEEWGMDGVLSRLRGMFAFCLYDQRIGKCFVARDRLGIKPLYYCEAAGSVAFASEVRALRRAGLSNDEISRDGLAGFLLLGSVPHPHTIYRDIRCLEPGAWLEVNAAGCFPHVYWRPGETGPEASLTDVLEDTVRRHLISDAPLGLFLSGGVDSNALATLAGRAKQDLRTLTVSFDEAAHDEPVEDHREKVCVGHQDFLEALPAYFASVDQPSNDGLNTWFVARAAKSHGLRAALSGAGADEIFWGYRHHHFLTGNQTALRAWGGLPQFVQIGVASLMRFGGKAGGPESLPRIADTVGGSAYLALRGFFSKQTVHRLTGLDCDRIDVACGVEGSFADPVAFQRVEMRRYLHDQLLRDADVFGMACSLEIRVPFVDHVLVERVTSDPRSRELRRGVNKPLLVDAVGDSRVLDAARRPKKGFTLPLREWMLKDSGGFLERALRSPLLNPTEVKRLWRAFEAGRMNASRAWALVVLGGFADG